MCVVSNMIDSAGKQWPPFNSGNWNLPTLTEFQQIINKLAEIDRKLGAKDCYDPKKDEVIAQLQARIKELEAKEKKVKELLK